MRYTEMTPHDDQPLTTRRTSRGFRSVTAPRRHRSIAIAVAALALLVAAPVATVSGRDEWLVAGAQLVTPEAAVRLALVTAYETFPVSESAATPQRVHAWIVMHDDEHTAVTSFVVDEERNELYTTLTLAEPGLHVVGVTLQPRFIETEAAGFQQYLTREHADAALALREQRRAELRTGRERYTSMVKTIVRVEDPASASAPDTPPGTATGTATGSQQGAPAHVDRTYRHALGHMLEIIPLSDPTRWNAGDEVDVRVMFDHDAAADVYVSSGHESLPAHKFAQTVRTNKRGVARVRIDRPGCWFLRAHVIRPLDAARFDDGAEWESFRATLTFRAGQADSAKSPTVAPRP